MHTEREEALRLAEESHLFINGFCNVNWRACLVEFVRLARQSAPQQESPKFPTMLRKLWSGGEVQEWIDRNWAASQVAADEKTDYETDAALQSSQPAGNRSSDIGS